MKIVVLLMVVMTGSIEAQVTYEHLLRAAEEPQNWLTYSGTYLSQRYSTLAEITPENVKDLEQQWIFQTRSLEKFETTPLVVNGILYTVQAPNDVVAMDAATGRIFWISRYTPSADARPCCGRLNRGLAILGDTLYMGTIDLHLLAIDAKNGQVLWNVQPAGATAAAGYAYTHAPPDRQRQSNHGHRGRRVRHPGLHFRVRRAHQGGLAFQHRPGSGRTGQRDLGR